MFIHDFWLEFFPQFLGKAEFLYYILDFLTIIAFLRIMTFLPALALGTSKKI